MPGSKEKTPIVGSVPKAQTTTQTTTQTGTQTGAPAVPQEPIAAEKKSVDRAQQPEVSATYVPTRDEIEGAAYLLYLERGGLDGFAEQDWLQAESDLIEG